MRKPHERGIGSSGIRVEPKFLRVYDPAECDEHGVPLDWERCRACGGSGGEDVQLRYATVCPTCDGYGSLKAAALTARMGVVGLLPGQHNPFEPRCEDCGHPMSEGTWEPPVLNTGLYAEVIFKGMAGAFRRGDDPPVPHVHFSPCDEGCRHGGPGRGKIGNEWVPFSEWTVTSSPLPTSFQASWRPVDVRTLGWPHDLRPEKIAVLCLRCAATRP